MVDFSVSTVPTHLSAGSSGRSAVGVRPVGSVCGAPGTDPSVGTRGSLAAMCSCQVVRSGWSGDTSGASSRVRSADASSGSCSAAASASARAV
ncbi:Uncharacterised protein [Mycobacteroides abscessus]|nr:Uncharacterised protein [Mycobacteroides abscessus]